MADLTPTAANVAPVNLTDPRQTADAAVAIAAGQAVYLSTSDGLVYLSDATSATQNGVSGVAINSAAAGQPVTFQTGGDIDLGSGSGVLQGTAYYVSGAVAGRIAPEADLTSGEYMSLIGMGLASNQVRLALTTFGSVHV